MLIKEPNFQTFNPKYIAYLKNRAKTAKRLDPDLIRAIGEAEVNSAQAELSLIIGSKTCTETEDLKIDITARKLQLKRMLKK